MSIVVEHEKRRREILEKALDVFVDEGYEDVTFQKIADRCRITRTTLYIYFKNKREIFNFSIKQLLQGIENDITSIKKERQMSYSERLIRVMTIILEGLEQNRRLLSVVLDYLIYASKGDYDPGYRVRRRTVRLRHIMSTLIIEGIKAGEFIKSLNIKDANELLYGFIETAALRLTILRNSSVAEIKGALNLAVRSLSLNGG